MSEKIFLIEDEKIMMKMKIFLIEDETKIVKCFNVYFLTITESFGLSAPDNNNSNDIILMKWSPK